MPSQRTGFGPWSTALDNGTRMQLSAFWRRRMFGLGQLPMKRTSRRWIVFVGMAALLLGATPMLQLASDAAAEERSDVETTAATPSAEATKLAADEGSEFLRKITREAAPLLATLAEKRGYGLAPGEAVKRVAPPFPKERMEWYRVGQPGQAEAIPSGPDSMLFHWRDGKLHNWGMSFGGPGLEGIIRDVLGIYPQDIIGLERVSGIKGDWIVDPQASVEERLTQLQTILNEQAKVAIRLRFVEVEREVYVARGDYQFKPLPGQLAVDETQLTDRISRTDPIQVFGEELFPDSGAGGGTGNWGEFLEWVGRWTGSPIVSEVATPPAGEVSWRLHEPSPYTDRQRQAAHNPELVLANITKQTGIQFAKEARKVRVLKVELDDAKAATSTENAASFVQIAPTPANAQEVENSEIPKGTAQLFSRAAAPNADEQRAMDALRAKRLDLTKRLGETGLYSLAPGELIKFVPAADVGKLRQEYVKLMSDGDRRLTALFQLNDGRPQETSWTYDEQSLAETLDFIFGVKLHRLRGDEELFTVPMPEGDWVCGFDPREKPPLTPELVASLEKTLSHGLGMPLKLSLEKEKGPVLVAQGDYKSEPMADETGEVQRVTGKVAETADGTFFFPVRRGLATGTVGDFKALLEDIGEVLLTPIVDEVANRPTKRSFFWRFPNKPHVDFLSPLSNEERDQVMAAFEKQTGLTLTPEEREVEMLMISRGAPEKE